MFGLVSELNNKILLDLRLSEIFEFSSNLVLFIDKQGNIIYVNEAFCKNSGYSKEELKDYNFKDILSNEFRKVFDNHIKENLMSGNNWKGELKHIKKDLTPYWTSSSFTKLFDVEHNQFGYFVIEDEITSIKELTTQLEYRANLLYEDKLKIETILNKIPFSIIVLETDGTILYENDIFKTSFKSEFTREPLVNSNINSYLPNIIIEKIIELINDKDKNEIIVNLESNIHLQINITPLEYFDKETIIIVVIRDITNFIEFELIQQQFVTTISHELRTPIASVLLSINNFVKYKERLNEEQNDNLLKIIQQNANTLKNIVEDLLIISHIDNKKLKLRNWIRIELFSQISSVILQLKPQLDNKNITFTLNCEKNIFLFSDEERFNQILRIPIENAIKYSQNGKEIILSMENSYKGKYNPDNVEGVLIKIKDFGIGIKSSEQKYLFKRFFRGSNVQNLQGTGIGLSILRELVILVNGLVYIESAENIGTEVIIFLPLLENTPS